MEILKLTKNLEFDVIYADGNKRRVGEGILMEVEEDGHMVMHNGTDRKVVLFATIEALLEAVAEMGLSNQLTRYLQER